MLQMRTLGLLLLLLAGCTPPPSFTLSLSPSSLTLQQGQSGTLTLTLTPQNGFNGTVNLGLQGAPAGVSLSPSSLNVSGSGPVTQTLTLSVASGVATGPYPLTLQASRGSLSKSASLSLTVELLTFLVNTTADTHDATPGDRVCQDSNGNCSVRAALEEAGALSQEVVVQVPAGTYTLDARNGGLRITGQVDLRGAGAATILDGNNSTRVLEVVSGASARLEGLSVRNGNVSTGGGGLYNAGTATLTNVTFSHNSALTGGGLYNAGTATLTNVTFSHNSALTGGGGLYNAGTATLTGVTFSGNSADGGGGGLYNAGTATLTGVTFSHNSANFGGGLYNAATATLTGVTFSHNSAGTGGGLYNDGTAKVSFSTFSQNSVNYYGGGIFILSGTVQVKGVILSGNSAGADGPECGGSLTSQGYNLVQSTTGCGFTAASTDITGSDAQLGPLADNGGPVQTHLPNAGSPALDKVPPSDCTDLDGNTLATDARGVSRPQGAACDIGAVER